MRESIELLLFETFGKIKGRMKSLVIVLSCLSALVLANPRQEVLQYSIGGQRTCRLNCQRTHPGANPLVACPPTNCPPAIRDGNCGEPDCSIEANQRLLHPHADPNFFYQCAPLDAWGRWRVVTMTCGCKTLFYSPANRCVHREEWQRECPTQPENPEFIECPVSCPGDCNGNGPNTPAPPLTTQAPPQTTQAPPQTTQAPPQTTQAPPQTTQAPPQTTQPPPQTTQAPDTTESVPTTPVPGPDNDGDKGGNGDGGNGDDEVIFTTTGSPPNGCQCPCIPCVWWPCQPCLANCACGNNNQPQQIDHWQRPG